MKLKAAIIFLFLFCIMGSFFVGRIFGIYSHSMSEENEYPFYLRDTLSAHQPSCSDYKAIVSSNEKYKIKVVEHRSGKNVVVIMTTEDAADGGVRFLVSILNHQHEQYFDEIFLDCPQ